MVTTVWIVSIIYLIAMLAIGMAVSKKGSASFDDYAIAGKSLPFYLIMWTFLATVWGAADFIGSPDEGYHRGISWIAWTLGSEGGKIVFALTLAGFLARFSFKSMGEFMDNVVAKDKTSRIVIGLLTGFVAAGWTGAQSMAIGQIFSVFTGTDSTLMIIIASAVFIFYTMSGGLLSVVWTDVIQGLLIVAFAGFYWYYAFGMVDFSLATLASKVMAAKPELWSLTGASGSIPWLKLFTTFLTGIMGTFTMVCYWQRAFSAKDVPSARNAALIGGIGTVLVSVISVFIGLIVFTVNPNLDTGVAPYLVKNFMPPWITVAMTLLVLAATMSSADSLLNIAAIITVNDILMPLKPDVSDEQKVAITKWVTLAWGVVGVICALKFKFILGLVGWLYSTAAGALAPAVIVGLLWRKPGEYIYDNSNITPVALRYSLILGTLTAIIARQIKPLMDVFGGPVIPSSVVTIVLLFIISSITKKETVSSRKIHV